MKQKSIHWRNLALLICIFITYLSPPAVAQDCIVLNPQGSSGDINSFLFIDYSAPGHTTYVMPAATSPSGCNTFCFEDCTIEAPAPEGEISGSASQLFTNYDVKITDASSTVLFTDADFASGPPYCFTLPGAGTYTITVYYPSTTTVFVSTTITIVPITPPTTLVVNLDPDSVCTCEEVNSQFPEAIQGYNEYYTVHWQLSDGLNEYKIDGCQPLDEGEYYYTVDAMDGCANEYYALDTFWIVGPHISFDATANCMTACVDPTYSCFDGIAGITYSWNWGDGTFSTSDHPDCHNYSSPGTYTINLTVTWPGGSATVSHTVTVVSAYPATVFSPENSCDPTAYVLVSPTVGTISSVTYTIISGSGTYTSSFPAGSWTITGMSGDLITQYDYIDSKGCHGFVLDTIKACCFPYPTPTSSVYHTYANTSTALTDYLGSALWPGTLSTDMVVSGKTIYVYDNLVLNVGSPSVPFVFDNCTIKVYPGKEMDIYTTKGVKFQNCLITAMCQEMWDGVYIPDENTKLIATNSTFEQALNAVVSNNGGVFNISGTTPANSKFFNCWKGIVINGWPSGYVHSGFVYGTKFSSVTGNLLPPHNGSGIMMYEGIEINGSIVLGSIGQITIGNASSSSTALQFDNMRYGLKSLRYDVDNYNSSYTNIVHDPLAPFPVDDCETGTAVCLRGGKFVGADSQIGGTATNQLCSFATCYNGIHAMNYVELYAESNTFTTMARHGIYCSMDASKHITLKNNVFAGYDLGIHCYSSSQSTYVIDKNYFNNNGSFSVAPTTGNVAILMEEASPLNSKAQITNNIIKYNTYGIWLRNVQGTILGNYALSNNDIRTNNTTPSSTNKLYGIKIENSKLILVENNTIWKANLVGSLPTTAAPIPTSATAPYLFGITTELSQYCFVRGNHIYKMGRNIYVLGNCSNTFYRCNDMNMFWTGFLFSSAIIPSQYTDGAITHGDQSNLYNSGVVATGAYHLDGNVITSTGINWYTLTTGAYSNSPFNTIGITYMPPSPMDCSAALPPYDSTAGNEQREAMFGATVRGEQTYTEDSTENVYWDNQSVYSILTQYPELVNMGYPEDADYIDFMNNQAGTEVGQSVEVYKQIGSGNLDSAQLANDSRLGGNLIDENSIAVVNIYLKLLSGDTLSTSDSTSLNDIAWSDPVTGGEGVYMARVILGIDPSQTEGMRSMKLPVQSQSSVSLIEVKVYPNPTSELFTVEIDEATDNSWQLLVVDVTGKAVINQIPQQISSLDVKSLPEGLYLLVIRQNGQTLNEQKLIIQH